MTFQAADRKKKGSASLCEQHRLKKKKKLDSSHCMSRLSPRTYLERNDAQIEDTVKKEQVGITWMDMAPFVDSPSKSCTVVADEISVPLEIFDLDNLNEVLSYEAWTKCLTESERKLLAQFLPSCSETNQVVQSLLMGANHHFGNPFHKWSTSLCSGKLEPNAMLSKSRQLLHSKRIYYSDLNEYHTGMIDVLGRWKRRWMSCKGPEKLLREGPIKYNQKRFPHSDHANGTLPNSTRRDRGRSPNSTIKDKAAPVSKRELPPIICIRHNGSTKHMSHIKINSRQYQLIRKLKPSENGISLKSLCDVLGDINCFPPLRASEDDEKKKLHELWAQLAAKDIPAAFKYHRAKKLQREQWGKFLEQELAEKRKSVMATDEEVRNLQSLPQEQASTRDSGPSTIDVLIPNNPHLGQILFNDTQRKLGFMISNQREIDEVAPRAESSPIPFYSLGKTNPPEDSGKLSSSISSPDDLLQAHRNHELFDRSTETQIHISTPPSQHQSLTNSCGEKNFQQPQLQPFMANNSFPDLQIHHMTNTDAFTSNRYPDQSSYGGALAGHNWFSDKGQACNGLSEIGPFVSGGQYLGGCGDSLDRSHYNIVSGFDLNEPYGVSRSEQFSLGTNHTRGVSPTHRSGMVRSLDPAGSNASQNGVPWMASSNQNPDCTLNQNLGFPGSVRRAFHDYQNQ